MNWHRTRPQRLCRPGLHASRRQCGRHGSPFHARAGDRPGQAAHTGTGHRPSRSRDGTAHRSRSHRASLASAPEARRHAHRRSAAGRDGWPIYCAGKEENADPYCTPWARQRMGAFSTTPNLSAPYRDRRVRAAAAVSPSYAMMFTPASLSRIRIPLLLLRAERTPLYTLQHAERLLSAMPQPPQLGVLPDADTASLMSSCGGQSGSDAS